MGINAKKNVENFRAIGGKEEASKRKLDAHKAINISPKMCAIQ